MPKKKGLYDNIRARQKKGISRSKSESTVDPKIYKQMSEKTGPFSERKSVASAFSKKGKKK